MIRRSAAAKPCAFRESRNASRQVRGRNRQRVSISAELAGLDFPSFPVRQIYFPVTPKKIPGFIATGISCKSQVDLTFSRAVGRFGTTKYEIPGSREFAGHHARLARLPAGSILAVVWGMPV